MSDLSKKDVVVLEHNTKGIKHDMIPEFPIRAEFYLNPPEFMRVAFVMSFGGCEKVVLGARSVEALDHFLEGSGFNIHPRLTRTLVTDTRTGEILRTKSVYTQEKSKS